MNTTVQRLFAFIVIVLISLSELSANEIDSQIAEENIKQEIITAIAEELSHREPIQVKNNLRREIQSVIKLAVKEKNTKEVHQKKTLKRLVAHNNSIAKKRMDKAQSNNIGWVYIGQFLDNQWLEKILKVSNTLPELGKTYLIKQSVNIRNALPSNGEMSKVISVLSPNKKVKIIKLYQSGRKGHYWAKLQWF